MPVGCSSGASNAYLALGHLRFFVGVGVDCNLGINSISGMTYRDAWQGRQASGLVPQNARAGDLSYNRAIRMKGKLFAGDDASL
jgi:hypothetical protein